MTTAQITCVVFPLAEMVATGCHSSASKLRTNTLFYPNILITLFAKTTSKGQICNMPYTKLIGSTPQHVSLLCFLQGVGRKS